MTRTLDMPNPRVVVPIVAGIGNALMAQPMVRQIKKLLPRSHITVVARLAAMGEVFQRLSEVDRVLVMQRGSLGMARTMLNMGLRRRPDALIVPFPSNRWQYMMLALASLVRHRVLHSYPVGYFAALGCMPADRIPAVRGLHDVVQNLRLLRVLGFEPQSAQPPVFPILESDRALRRRASRRAGSASRFPSHRHSPGQAQTVLARAKRWAPENYAALASRLRHAHPVIFLEGPDERGVAREILRFCQDGSLPVLRLTGPLCEAAAVLARRGSMSARIQGWRIWRPPSARRPSRFLARPIPIASAHLAIATWSLSPAHRARRVFSIPGRRRAPGPAATKPAASRASVSTVCSRSPQVV